MAAILGPNDRRLNLVIGVAHGERALNWTQLTEEYKGYAFALHEFALGEAAKGPSDVGPIYTRQALAMQRRGVRMAS